MRSLFLLVFSLCLLGCKRPDHGQTEIQYSFWGSTKQMEVERQVIEAFENLNPDVRVRMLPVGMRYTEKIQAMMIGNVAPDVIMVELTVYDEWASRGVLTDLTDLAKTLGEKDPFMPAAEKVFERDGRYFAIPVNAHGHVLYMNLDALKKAGIAVPDKGWSWSEILELGPKLSRRNGDPDAPTDFLMLMPNPVILFFASGGKLFDDPARPSEVTADSQESRAAFQLMRDFYQSGYVVPTDVSDAEGTYQLFRDGRIAFYISGRWATPELADQTEFDWDVTNIPSGPTGAVTALGGTALAVWSGSRHAEAAKRFIEFYASDVGVRIVTQGGRYVPVSKQAAFGEEFLNLRPPDSMRRFSETMETGAGQIFLYAPGQAQVTRIFGNRVSQALNLPDVSTEEVVTGLESDLKRWMERRSHRGPQPNFKEENP